MITTLNSPFQATVQSSFNKFFIGVTPSLWLETYIKHEDQTKPLLYMLEGGLAYPGQERKASFKVTELSTQEFQGQVHLDLGHNLSSIEFTVERGNSPRIDYIFTVTASISGWEPLFISGKIALSKGKHNADMVWKYGKGNYSATVEYIEGSEQIFTGTVRINNAEYVGKFIIKETKEDKSIFVELTGHKHIQLFAQTTKTYDSMLLDIFWDKNVDDNKRISLKAGAGPGSLLVEFIANKFKGKFRTTFTSSTIDIDASWDIHHLQAKVKFEVSRRNFEILVALNTSQECLKEIIMHVKLSYERGLHGVEMDSRVSNTK